MSSKYQQNLNTLNIIIKSRDTTLEYYLGNIKSPKHLHHDYGVRRDLDPLYFV